MSETVLHRGTKLEIRCLVLADGSSPALEFWKGLNESEQQKLMVAFSQMGEMGRIRNPERFKKLEGSDGIYEFKSFQIRIFCFQSGPVLYLAYGLRKKQDRHRKQDITRAEEYRSWFLAQQNPRGKRQ